MLIEVTKNINKVRKYKVRIDIAVSIFCDRIEKDKYGFLTLYIDNYIVSVIYIDKNKIKVTDKKDM